MISVAKKVNEKCVVFSLKTIKIYSVQHPKRFPEVLKHMPADDASRLYRIIAE